MTVSSWAKTGWMGLLAACFAGWAASAGATTFYVDSVAGNDGNSGTDSGAPWKTLYQIEIVTFQAGDRILLKRGSVWREYLDIRSSGAAGNPVVFGAYGSGSLPVISGANTLSASTHEWRLSTGGTNEYYLTALGGANPGLSQVRLLWRNQISQPRGTLGSLQNNQWNWGNNDALGFNTLYWRRDTGTPGFAGDWEAGARYRPVDLYQVSYVDIEDWEIRQANGEWGGCLGIGESDHVNVRRCLLREGHDTVVLVYHMSGRPLCTNFIFEDNTISGARNHDGPSGILFLLDASNCIVRRNALSETTYTLLNVEGDGGGHLIEDNEFSGSDKALLTIDEVLGGNNVVRYNRLHGVSGPGSWTGIYLGDSSGNTLHSNLIYDIDGYHALQVEGITTTPAANWIYNNTLALTAANVAGIQCGGTVGGLEIKNNVIVVGGNAQALIVEAVSTAGVVSDHNLMRNTFGALVAWAGISYPLASFAAYQAASGQDAHSLTSDPLFQNATAYDFHLQTGSPAINAGTGVGLTRDFDGVSVPMDGLPDMGAYEAVPTARALSLQWVSAPFALVFNQTQNNFAGQIDCQILDHDQLQSLRVQNLGTARAGESISRLRLWRRANGAQSGTVTFDPLQCQPLGDLAATADRTWDLTLNQTLLPADALYLTVDLAAGAQAGQTIRLSLPAGGAVFAYSTPLMASAISAANDLMIQRQQMTTLAVCSRLLRNVAVGQRGLDLGDVVVANVSGQTLALTSLRLALQDGAGRSLAPGQAGERWWLEQGGAAVSTLLPPFSGGLLFTFSPAVTLSDQAQAVLTLKMDVSAQPETRRFQVSVPDAQTLNWGQVSTAPASGAGFPLAFDAANLLAPELSSSFHIYPNPVRPAASPARIVYYLEQSARVQLTVMTLDGRRVYRLGWRQQGPGMQEGAWDGRNENGLQVRSGVYVLKLEAQYAGGKRETLTRRLAVAH
ncbi:MAG: right-handed parallel beta-helix repeat-containing protein [candidate division FCPU426 bacterium]